MKHGPTMSTNLCTANFRSVARTPCDHTVPRKKCTAYCHPLAAPPTTLLLQRKVALNRKGTRIMRNIYVTGMNREACNTKDTSVDIFSLLCRSWAALCIGLPSRSRQFFLGGRSDRDPGVGGCTQVPCTVCGCETARRP